MATRDSSGWDATTAWRREPPPDYAGISAELLPLYEVPEAWEHLPGLFDVAHDATAYVVHRSSHASPAILDGTPVREAEKQVPMGYTQLSVVEQRAVVDGDGLVRRWPPWPGRLDGYASARYQAKRWGGPRPVLIGPTGVRLGPKGWRWWPIDEDLDLDATVALAHDASRDHGGVPIMVGRTLAEADWH